MRHVRIFAMVLVSLVSIQAVAGERVRVAVFGLFHPKQLVVEASPSSPVLVQSDRAQFVAGVGAIQRIALAKAGDAVVTRTVTTHFSGTEITFSARAGGDSDIVLSVPGRIRRRYRGTLTVVPAGDELVAVVEMDLETAVASIVAAEMSAEAPIEAMKAQAVVSRSYLVGGGHRHPYAEFCDTTHCQFLREPPSPKSRAAIAARATQGLVLKWRDKPLAAMFSASCGGRTHSLSEIGVTTTDYPYYSVECPYCRRAPEKWSSRLSQQDAAALSAPSEPERIKTGRKLGWHAVQSNTYVKKSDDGAVDLAGVGRGHGVGLCQRGAVEMARLGKNFREILAYYFPNTTI